MTTLEKIAALREEMKKNEIDAFIVYSADPHMSEYLPLEWKEREWLSGFTGSAGLVVITADKAGLWTDGRYFTQALMELEGSGIDLFKMGVEGTPHYIDWIISETPENAKIALNSTSTSHAQWKKVESKLGTKGKKLVHHALLDEVWNHRYQHPEAPIFVHPPERAGQTVTDKIMTIREKMKEEGASGHIIAALDDVSWTLNLRGSDVECNPVFLGYLYISMEEVVFFVKISQLNDEAQSAMKDSGVILRDYDAFFAFLTDLNNEKVWVSSNSNQAIFDALQKENEILEKPAPGHLMKAVKNKNELEGFKKVMVRDGVAMVKFLYWVTHTVGQEPLTEYDIGQKLLKFRAEGENFVGPSFNSIVGYNGNGAIIHYTAPEKGSSVVTDKGSLLVDSGGQYLEGTTDITRTFPLGEVTEKFKKDATKVLKGLIQLSMVRFPKGTTGAHLDAFARMPLWKEGKDFNHGTGHGVGSFLNVHEGPQSIRKDLNPIKLEEGMVLSNEPGYYVEGEYGIRHENLLVVKERETTAWNTFYEFETLTLCPFFKSIIKKDLLSEEEIKWLNQYHQKCKESLAAHLEGKVKEWFLDLIRPI